MVVVLCTSSYDAYGNTCMKFKEHILNGFNDQLFGKGLFIRFSASAFRGLPSVCVFSYFPFGFEGRMWDLIVSVPDHCLSFYFKVVERT